MDFVIYNEGDVKEKNIITEKIKGLRHGFVYNENYFKDNIKNLEDLNNYPLILQNKESNSRKF